MKKSTFIKLGVVAALVLLPRRSSKKSDCNDKKSGKGCGCSATNNADNTNDKQACDSKKGCDCKNCKCPLCRIGKCPLCAIGKCFCCKKSADKADKKGCCGKDKSEK